MVTPPTSTASISATGINCNTAGSADHQSGACGGQCALYALTFPGLMSPSPYPLECPFPAHPTPAPSFPHLPRPSHVNRYAGQTSQRLLNDQTRYGCTNDKENGKQPQNPFLNLITSTHNPDPDLSGKFQCNGPLRVSPIVPQRLLQSQVIKLENDAICIIAWNEATEYYSHTFLERGKCGLA